MIHNPNIPKNGYFGNVFFEEKDLFNDKIYISKMKIKIIFLFSSLLFFSSCSNGYLSAGLSYDKGNFGEGNLPSTRSGGGLNAETGIILDEEHLVGLNVGITGYSNNVGDGEPTFYANLMYARLFSINDTDLNFVLGGELGRAQFANYNNMASTRIGLLYQIPLTKDIGIHFSLLERPQFLWGKNGSEFNNNISFSVGLAFR